MNGLDKISTISIAGGIAITYKAKERKTKLLGFVLVALGLVGLLYDPLSQYNQCVKTLTTLDLKKAHHRIFNNPQPLQSNFAQDSLFQSLSKKISSLFSKVTKESVNSKPIEPFWKQLFVWLNESSDRSLLSCDFSAQDQINTSNYQSKNYELIRCSVDSTSAIKIDRYQFYTDRIPLDNQQAKELCRINIPQFIKWII
ncbi:MAG: hypothetical protein JXA94_02925 [Parachlamydiales bacterium]|nr:hypothetical protein [Parachlamydiales bacterium]